MATAVSPHSTTTPAGAGAAPPSTHTCLSDLRLGTSARVIALQEVIWMGESFMKGNSGIAGLVWPLFFTAVYYLIFSGIVTVLLGKLEKKLDFFQ